MGVRELMAARAKEAVAAEGLVETLDCAEGAGIIDFSAPWQLEERCNFQQLNGGSALTLQGAELITKSSEGLSMD